MATLDAAPAAAPTVQAPDEFNAATWLVTRHAQATPDRRAITAIDLDGSVRTLTYAELEDAVIRFAAALIASGVRPEERLLLCMGDTPELLTAFLAGLRIGAVPVPVSTMLKPKDIAVLARDSRARLLVVSEEFVALAPAVGGLTELADVVVVTSGELPEVATTRVRDWDPSSRPAPTSSSGRRCPIRRSRTPPRSGCTRPARPARPRARCTGTGRCATPPRPTPGTCWPSARTTSPSRWPSSSSPTAWATR